MIPWSLVTELPSDVTDQLAVQTELNKNNNFLTVEGFIYIYTSS